VKRFLLWLWRVLPLSSGLQFALLWLINPKFLLGVVGVVVDDRGRVLLLDHSYRNESPWALPGGWLRRGEQPAEALVRELREEVGLEVTDVTLLDVHLDPSVPRADISLVCRPARPDARPVPADVEVRAAGFYHLESFPHPLREDQTALIRRALRRLGRADPADRPR